MQYTSLCFTTLFREEQVIRGARRVPRRPSVFPESLWSSSPWNEERADECYGNNVHTCA